MKLGGVAEWMRSEQAQDRMSCKKQLRNHEVNNFLIESPTEIYGGVAEWFKAADC